MPISALVRIDQLVAVYIDERHRQGEITLDVRKRLGYVLGRFAVSYGERDPRRLGMADVERWLRTRSHLAASSRRGEWAAVRCFVRWMVEHGHLRTDPFVGRKAPQVPRQAGRALTTDQTAALEAVLPDKRAWAIYALMRWVGLRRGEVVRLQVGDWDRRSGILHIVGKGGHHRKEPVPDWVAVHLDAYLAEVGAKAGPMIRSRDGGSGIGPAYVSQMTTRWMRAAGVKDAPFDGRSAHALRHTIASEIAESGADVRTVQELLGHTSLTSTQIYLRNSNAKRVLAAMQHARNNGGDAA